MQPHGDHIDQMMQIMEASFDPKWGEAWNRRQLSDSLYFPHTEYYLIDTKGALIKGGGFHAPQAASLETITHLGHTNTSNNYENGGQKAAGFCLVKSAGFEDEILLIAVHPDHRGKGWGTKLIEMVKRTAIERKAERIFLEMRENNAAAHLYQAAGFIPIGRRNNYYNVKGGGKLDAITFAAIL